MRTICRTLFLRHLGRYKPEGFKSDENGTHSTSHFLKSLSQRGGSFASLSVCGGGGGGGGGGGSVRVRACVRFLMLL